MADPGKSTPRDRSVTREVNAPTEVLEDEVTKPVGGSAEQAEDYEALRQHSAEADNGEAVHRRPTRRLKGSGRRG
jgi:hypothetical protein